MENRMDRDCGDRSHGGFRHILPFLAIPLAIGLMRGVARHKFSHMNGMQSEMRRDQWKNGVPPIFAELHRRAHAADEVEKSNKDQTESI